MTQGIEVLNNAGQRVVYTPDMSGLFFEGVGSYSQTQDVSISDPSKLDSFYSIAPTEDFSISGPSSDDVNLKVNGIVDQETDIYYSPQVNYISSSIPDGNKSRPPTEVFINNMAAEVFSFKSVDANQGHGIFSRGDSDNSAINSDFTPFYVEPDGDGNFLRSKTVSSVPFLHGFDTFGKDKEWAFLNPGFSVQLGSFGTIIDFERPYENPPLVFIKSSSDFVSFNGYVTNSSGEYTGARLICAQATGDIDFPYPSNYTLYGWGPYYENSSFVEYFVISNDPPIAQANDNFGIKVFSENGSVIYNTEYLVPTFKKETVPLAYGSTSGHPVGDNGGFRSFDFNESTVQVPSESFGVMINNFVPILSRVAGTSPDWPRSGVRFYDTNSFVQAKWLGDTYCGSFLKGNAQSGFTVSGRPLFSMIANAFFADFWYNEVYFDPSITTMPIIKANYTFY